MSDILLVGVLLLLVVGGGIYYFFFYKKPSNLNAKTRDIISGGDEITKARIQLDKQADMIKSMQAEYLKNKESLLNQQIEFNKAKESLLKEKEEFEKLKLDIRAAQSNVNAKVHGISAKEKQLQERKSEVEQVLVNTKVEIEEGLLNKHKVKFELLEAKEKELAEKEAQYKENMKEFQKQKDEVDRHLVRAEELDKEATEKLNRIEMETQNLTMKENALNNNLMLFNNYQAQFTLTVKEEIERINNLRNETQKNYKHEMKRLDKEKAKLLADKENFHSYIESENNKIGKKKEELVKKKFPFLTGLFSNNTNNIVEGEFEEVKHKSTKKTKAKSKVRQNTKTKNKNKRKK